MTTNQSTTALPASHLPASSVPAGRTRPSAPALVFGSLALWGGTAAIINGATTLDVRPSMTIALTATGLALLLAIIYSGHVTKPVPAEIASSSSGIPSGPVATASPAPDPVSTESVSPDSASPESETTELQTTDSESPDSETTKSDNLVWTSTDLSADLPADLPTGSPKQHPWESGETWAKDISW